MFFGLCCSNNLKRQYYEIFGIILYQLKDLGMLSKRVCAEKNRNHAMPNRTKMLFFYQNMSGVLFKMGKQL